MKIIYCHHALRKLGNPPSQNDDIKKLGKKDAKLVSDILLDAQKHGSNIKAIYTSPYLRCKKTAEIINKHINVPIIEDSRLNEFVNVHHAVKYGLSADASENWVDCQNRVIECIKDIVLSFNDNDTVICVTSGVNITAFISVAFKIKPNNNLPFPLVPSCSPIGFNIDKSFFKDDN